MRREVHFQFDIPAPVGGIAKSFFASEFSDQNRNRNHILNASASTGIFTLSWLTEGNLDEVVEKAGMTSQNIIGKTTSTAGWEMLETFQSVYWTYQAQNTEDYTYLITFPLTLYNAAGAASDVPAGGAIIKLTFELNLL